MQDQAPKPPPLSRREIVEAYFLEHRAKVLDVAAFLDRVDRASSVDRASGSPVDPRGEDFRLTALRGAIEILVDGQPDRARRILELWSDPTEQVIDAAPGKGAVGVWPGDGRHESSGAK